ncbi:filamin-B-like [Anneissia japonica]|uniref:filamin-B-like n=1 Tax=Anneissia japonica TaxID=1529436 RepID=UPI0014256E7D|nr:filamin-B-like [Anneissia japonica]
MTLTGESEVPSTEEELEEVRFSSDDENDDEVEEKGEQIDASRRWVHIQKKTFTNWCNEQLREDDDSVDGTTVLSIDQIESAFTDGILLIKLMEKLIKKETNDSASEKPKKIKRRYSKNPKLKAQKMDNIAYALEMMTEEGIQLINIGAADIAEGNIKIILGLVWRLVQKYQISAGGGGGGQGSKGSKSAASVAPKKLILAWVNAVLPKDCEVKNFTSDWNDGIKLSALLDFCTPGLMSNWKLLDPSKKMENCQQALEAANKQFNIPKVLSAEDMSSPDLDDLSCLTYLSYFVKKNGPGWNATLNWVRRTIPQLNIQNFQSDWNDGIALCGLVNAVCNKFPDWLEMDKEAGLENCTKVLDFLKTRLGLQLYVSVQDLFMNRAELAICVIATQLYQCYTEGYQILDSVEDLAIGSTVGQTGIELNHYGDTGIKASESIGIEAVVTAENLNNPQVDELAVMTFAARYINYQPPAPLKPSPENCVSLEFLSLRRNNDGFYADVGESVTFKIRISDSSVSMNDIAAQVESLSTPPSISIDTKSATEAEATFIPCDEGEHKVVVRCQGQEVRGCPVFVMVMPKVVVPKSFPRKVVVTSQVDHIMLGEEGQVQIDASEAGEGSLTVEVSNGFHNLPIRITGSMTSFVVHIRAIELGVFKVFIRWNDQTISDDPLNLEVRQPGQIKVFGDGLSLAQEGRPSTFIVDPREGGKGELKVTVDGPNSFGKCSITPNPDGTYTVMYIPAEVGIFTIKVTWSGKEVKGSPFYARVTDPKRVRIVGGQMPGMASNGGLLFIIGFTAGHLSASIDDPNGNREPLQIEMVSSDRYRVKYLAEKEGTYLLRVMWANSPIPGSPFSATASFPQDPIDARKVHCTGKGIINGRVDEENMFHINGSGGGPGILKCWMTGSSTDINVDVVAVGGGLYKAVYTPKVAGTYLLHVTWSGDKVMGSPFSVKIAEKARAQSVTTKGTEMLRTLIAGHMSRLVIDVTEAGIGELVARCVGPATYAEVHIGDNQDGTYSLLMNPSEAGQHTLEIKFGQDHIQGSPFMFHVNQPPDASKVRCFGSGLAHGIFSYFDGRFNCNTTGAGAGQLKIRVHGPKGSFNVKVSRSVDSDRLINVKYSPTQSGEYKVSVQWSDVHVPGSPFHVWVVNNEKQLESVKKKYPQNKKYLTQTSIKSSSNV